MMLEKYLYLSGPQALIFKDWILAYIFVSCQLQ